MIRGTFSTLFLEKYSIFTLMNFPGRYLKLLISILCIAVPSVPMPVLGQSTANVPAEIEFAGVTIHLTEENRLKVKQEVRRLYAHPEAIDYLKRTTNQLAPQLAGLFKGVNMPNDFLYAALPTSDTDTIGFWRLTQEQGMRLNLQMDDQIDERYHPLVSTVVVLADISYWQKAQKNYASSLLCYLTGSVPSVPERITEHYFSPGQSTSPLFWEVLARKFVLGQSAITAQASSPYILYEYQNSAGKTLQGIVDQLQLPLDRTETYNRWIKESQRPIPRNYSLLIQVTPEEYTQIQSQVKPPEETKPGLISDSGFPTLRRVYDRQEGLRASAIFYRINDLRGIQAQHCDNLITLAYYGDIPIKSFVAYNDLTSNDVIRPGEIYYLESKAKRAKIPYHIVQKGQTLHKISNIYGVRLKSLQKFNYVLATQRLQPGRVLWLQQKRPTNQLFEYVQMRSNEPEEKEVVVPTPKVPVPEEMINEIDANPDIVVLKTEPEDEDSVLVEEKIDLPERPAPVTQNKVTPRKSAPVERTGSPANTNRMEVASYHTVQPGQTLYRVSVIYKVTVPDLMRWNNLKNNSIKVGQKLLIRNL